MVIASLVKNKTVKSVIFEINTGSISGNHAMGRETRITRYAGTVIEVERKEIFHALRFEKGTWMTYFQSKNEKKIRHHVKVAAQAVPDVAFIFTGF